jgi:hypothetical protein
MKLEIAKWRDNTVAPVLFMVDDIANTSIKMSKLATLQIGEDWGQYAQDKNSMWDFLSSNLLEKFPKIKTTFFLVADKRAPMALAESYTYTEAMNKNKKFMNFLRFLAKNEKIELAYHGTTHGNASLEHDDFLQEWETFESLDDAVEQIARGKELFKEVLDVYPSGGKYCGYEEGDFGSESIAKSSFKWWSYHWDGAIWDKNSKDSKYSYDIELNKGVVNIPTTVDGSTLSLKLFTRKYLKSLYLYLVESKTIEKHIDALYTAGQVISIQEHSSPYRTDGLIQYPNIVSDIDNLNIIFTHLAKKDVWYATCNDLADYYLARTNVQLHIEDDSFILLSENKEEVELTLILPLEKGNIKLCDENGMILRDFKEKYKKNYVTYLFNINKRYRVC